MAARTVPTCRGRRYSSASDAGKQFSQLGAVQRDSTMSLQYFQCTHDGDRCNKNRCPSRPRRQLLRVFLPVLTGYTLNCGHERRNFRYWDEKKAWEYRRTLLPARHQKVDSRRLPTIWNGRKPRRNAALTSSALARCTQGFTDYYHANFAEKYFLCAGQNFVNSFAVRGNNLISI